MLLFHLQPSDIVNNFVLTLKPPLQVEDSPFLPEPRFSPAPQKSLKLQCTFSSHLLYIKKIHWRIIRIFASRCLLPGVIIVLFNYSRSTLTFCLILYCPRERDVCHKQNMCFYGIFFLKNSQVSKKTLSNDICVMKSILEFYCKYFWIFCLTALSCTYHRLTGPGQHTGAPFPAGVHLSKAKTSFRKVFKQVRLGWASCSCTDCVLVVGIIDWRLASPPQPRNTLRSASRWSSWRRTPPGFWKRWT